MKKILGVVLVSISVTSSVFAGNQDRVAQAGANELLMNPWTRSAGFANANGACVKGLESTYLNIAGLAFTKKTELVFNNTSVLAGSGIKLNAFGFSQKVGKTGVMGMSVNSLNFGNIPITTVDNPEGGLGNYSVQFNNINISYAKEFSNSIYGGVNIKAITQQLSNLSAKGVAVDAGIQYLTGTNEERNNIHFGISLKNVGAPMRYRGDGLSIRRKSPITNTDMTVEQRSALIELPSQLMISGGYDFNFTDKHKVTLVGTFTSNSYTNNQFNGGLEYSFINYFSIRGGYIYEDTKKYVAGTTFFSGPTAGFTFETPFNKDKTSTIGIDYSFKATNQIAPFHSIGVRINL